VIVRPQLQHGHSELEVDLVVGVEARLVHPRGFGRLAEQHVLGQRGKFVRAVVLGAEHGDLAAVAAVSERARRGGTGEASPYDHDALRFRHFHPSR
jgi:hypothetical protein